MSVILIVDSYGMNDEDAVVVTSPDEILDIRKKIRNALNDSSNSILRIRLNSTLYNRIKDFEGLPGIEIKHIFPKVQLAKILGVKVPEWLTEKIIIDFQLLQSKSLCDSNMDYDNVARKVLCLINQGFSNLQSYEGFYKIIENIHDSFSDLLCIDEIFDLLLIDLNYFKKTDANKILLDELKYSKSPSLSLVKIGREQVLEKIRKFSHEHENNMSFPPRKYSPNLLIELPLYNIKEKDAGNILSILNKTLEFIDISVRNNQISPHYLSQIIVAWPSFIEYLSLLLDDNSKLASNALVDSLNKFEDEEIKLLSYKVSELIRLGHCDPLEISSGIDEAIDWCKEYLDYAMHCFLHEKEPDEKISYSYTKWLIDEQIRIKRSNKNWYSVSNAIESNLKNDNLVIVCMVDALGAIHLDLLKKELDESLEGICVDDELIFSPIPTLTEVCKMAVITGQDADSLSGSNQKVIIKNRFSEFLTLPDSLNIAQSWKDFRSSLTNNTKMLVCFENRIDERLHGCVNFKKHQKDVKQIIKSLVKDIHEWLITGAQLQKEVVVIITADHGVSSINKQVSCEFDKVKNIGERTCWMDSEPLKLPQSTFFIHENSAKSSGYIVPTDRSRYTGATPLVHGGLTAEEVMIPFVILTKGEKKQDLKPLEINLDQNECQIINDGWQIQLNLITHNETIEKIKISANSPFKGVEGPIGPLYPHKKTAIRFILGSNVEQGGLLNVSFTVTYNREGSEENERFNVTLHLNFPISLLDSNDEAKDFDDMFD